MASLKQEPIIKSGEKAGEKRLRHSNVNVNLQKHLLYMTRGSYLLCKELIHTNIKRGHRNNCVKDINSPFASYQRNQNLNMNDIILAY